MSAGAGVLEKGHDAVSTLFLVAHGADRMREGRRAAVPLLDREGCEDLALRGAHPDLLELTSPERTKVGIDQVREALRFAQFVPTQARRKVCLIPRAEDLTAEAANALLKALEEPPRGLVFLLVAETPGSLLPTIVSRSRTVRSSECLASTLAALRDRGYGDPEARYVIVASTRAGDLDRFLAERVDVRARVEEARETIGGGGSEDLLAAAVSDDPVLRREAVCDLIRRLAAGDVRLAVTAARELGGGRESRELALGFLEDLLAVAASHLRASAGVTGGSLDAETGGSFAASEACLRRFFHAAEEGRRAVDTYTAAEPVLLSLLLSLRGDDRG